MDDAQENPFILQEIRRMVMMHQMHITRQFNSTGNSYSCLQVSCLSMLFYIPYILAGV